ENYWNGMHSLSPPGGTHPVYLIPKNIRRRLARAKVWGEPRVCVGVTAAVLTINSLYSIFCE
uniref:Uncharacterized protein n=1 Tax=Callorhinchus milii TaxID=7868 RepID=A0A4W3IJV2_CALMI